MSYGQFVAKVHRALDAPFRKLRAQPGETLTPQEREQRAPLGRREPLLSRCDSMMLWVSFQELRRDLEREVDPRVVFDHPTVEGVARALWDGPDNGEDGDTLSDDLEWLARSGEADAADAPCEDVWAPQPAPQAPFTQLLSGDAGDAVGAGYEKSGGQVFRRSDGMQVVLLPACEVAIGQVGVAEPVHRVFVPAFRMDVEPVSVGAYCRFLNVVDPPPKCVADWLVGPNDAREAHLPVVWACGAWRVKPGVAASWPMILVSWYGANAYSLWAHGRDWRAYGSDAGSCLPTEAQWEYAARGDTPQAFPWGPGAERGQLQVCWADGHGAVAPPGRERPLHLLPLAPVNAPMGVSPFGLRHMAGNVWNWCRDSFDESFYASPEAKAPDAWRPGAPDAAWDAPRAERGGSWVGPAGLSRSSYRRPRPANACGRCLGFRCAAPHDGDDASTAPTEGSDA